jgi:L-2-hydroxycarboxylate dehydrogenase (NAD+)
VDVDALRTLAASILRAVGLAPTDAETAARVLVASDMRGIASHGVARLDWYVTMIDEGTIDPRATADVVRESASTAVLDAHNGMGHPAGVRAMEMAIGKAAEHDLGIVTVRHSNHYGIAGYYAMMALEHDQIGISLTNSHPCVVPTGGRVAQIGTNPIAFAAPVEGMPAFVLDMATAVVPRGRLEVAARRRQSLAEGWAVDKHGRPTVSPEEGLEGGLLPLGGPSITSGYKGYGLGAVVEILSAVLPGSLYGPLIHGMWDGGPSDLGQFFMAVNIAAFDDPLAYKRRMADFLQHVKASPRADPDTEILVAGEKEYRASERSKIHGVSLDRTVAQALAGHAERHHVDLPYADPR